MAGITHMHMYIHKHMCLYLYLNKAMFAFRTLYAYANILQLHRNGPGEALLNQRQGVNGSFVLTIGFPRIDIKQ